ncbi:MAG: thioesterase family protein [bacterium]
MSTDGDRREEFRVHVPITLRWGDVDVYGHVNNTVHYQLMDTAVNGWLIETVGRDVREGKAIGVVAETGCRYVDELHYPGEVSVGIGLERLGRRSVTYRLGLFGSGPTAAAIGRFVHVYVDRTSRQPVDVPEDIRHAVEQLRTD